MDFEPDEDQALLKAAVERFVGAAYADPAATRRAVRGESGGFGAAHWQRLADDGILGLSLSTAAGGLGADAVTLALAHEALGRGLVVEPVLDVAVIAGGLLDAAGHALAGEIAAGRVVATLAAHERAQRFRLDTPETRAEAGRLTGTKTAVRHAGVAAALLVTARDADGFGLYRVAADAPGLARQHWRLADGTFAADVTMAGVPAQRLGDWGPLAAVILPRARLVAAAEMLGNAQTLFDTTLAYVKTRQQFGQPIGSFQVLQHRLVDGYAALEQARSQLWRAALTPAGGIARAAAGAFAFVAEQAILVAHTAVQLHGGMGITDELLVGHGLKRIRVLAQTLGDVACALDDYAAAA